MTFIFTYKPTKIRLIIAVLIGLFSCLSSLAQVIPNASPQDWDTLPFKSYADYRLQPLNKSYVTTGILYGKVFLIAHLDEYHRQVFLVKL